MKQKKLLIQQKIGENIREGRKQLKLTQGEFAEIVGISVQSLSALENGIQFARMDTYCKIAEALILPLHALFFTQQSQNCNLNEQIMLFLYDCEKEEKMMFFNIMKEIKRLLRKPYLP